MEDLMDMIVNDEAPSQISDKIKEILFSKSAEKIDDFRPEVANNLFNSHINNWYVMDDLSDFFKLVATEKKKQDEEFKSLVGEDIGELIENIFTKQKTKKKTKNKITVIPDEPKGESSDDITPEFTPSEQKNLDGYLDFLEYSIKNNVKKSINEENKNSEIQQLKRLVYEIARDVKAQGGGGEVNLAYMDVPITSVTSSSYNITLNDYYVGVNYSGAVTLTLPKADREGKIFVIKDELGEASKGTNRYITIIPSDSDLIDGKDKAILAYDYGSLSFIWKNNSWRIF